MTVGEAATTAYRHAHWDTPWWANPNRSSGRYNRAGTSCTQYLCLHPLGPAAELLRGLGKASAADVDTVRLRLWVARVPTSGLEEISFDNAGEYGVHAEDLVGDRYAPTQELAQNLRADGVRGMRVPSAALPGTQTLVLFEPRVLSPYLLEPVDVHQQMPTAHAGETLVAGELLDWVRWRGDDHWALEEWRRTGQSPVWHDPPVRR